MTEPLWEGDIFAGKYKVERVIGQGAMGMVIAARHLGLDEPVAIKVLLPETREVPGMVDRFIREARAAARIRGDNVVRVSDVDTLPSGVPYMVMERLEGMDLAELCQSRRLGVGEVARHVQQVCVALGDAHAAGIVHRDIKPGNLFLARRRDGSSVVKVLDFGISKVTHGDHQATRAGAIFGSPSYMSPEQMASSKDVDGRTDLWALGVVLYEMLAGEVPFRAETMPQLCTAILHQQPPSIRTVRPDVPPELEAVILRCLEKDRTMRFSTAAELSAALAPFTADTTAPPAGAEAPRATGVGASSAPPASAVAPSMTQQDMSRSAAPLSGKKSPVGLIAGFSAGMLAAGIAIFFVLRSPRTEVAHVAPAPALAPVATEVVEAPKPIATAAATAAEPMVTPSAPASASAAPAVQPAPAPDARPAPQAGTSKPAASKPPKGTAADPFQGDRK